MSDARERLGARLYTAVREHARAHNKSTWQMVRDLLWMALGRVDQVGKAKED